MGCEQLGNDRKNALKCEQFKNNKLLQKMVCRWCFLQLSRDLPNDLVPLLSERVTDLLKYFEDLERFPHRVCHLTPEARWLPCLWFSLKYTTFKRFVVVTIIYSLNFKNDGLFLL